MVNGWRITKAIALVRTICMNTFPYNSLSVPSLPYTHTHRFPSRSRTHTDRCKKKLYSKKKILETGNENLLWSRRPLVIRSVQLFSIAAIVSPDKVLKNNREQTRCYGEHTIFLLTRPFVSVFFSAYTRVREIAPVSI